MSKNTDTLRKLGLAIVDDPGHATSNTGLTIRYCADEIDRLRTELESMRKLLAAASAYIDQACQTSRHANNPKNELI